MFVLFHSGSCGAKVFSWSLLSSLIRVSFHIGFAWRFRFVYHWCWWTTDRMLFFEVFVITIVIRMNSSTYHTLASHVRPTVVVSWHFQRLILVNNFSRIPIYWQDVTLFPWFRSITTLRHTFSSVLSLLVNLEVNQLRFHSQRRLVFPPPFLLLSRHVCVRLFYSQWWPHHTWILVTHFGNLIFLNLFKF